MQPRGVHVRRERRREALLHIRRHPLHAIGAAVFHERRRRPLGLVDTPQETPAPIATRQVNLPRISIEANGMQLSFHRNPIARTIHFLFCGVIEIGRAGKLFLRPIAVADFFQVHQVASVSVDPILHQWLFHHDGLESPITSDSPRRLAAPHQVRHLHAPHAQSQEEKRAAKKRQAFPLADIGHKKQQYRKRQRERPQVRQTKRRELVIKKNSRR